MIDWFSSPTEYKKLGLDEVALARGLAVIDRAVGDGEAHTRAELGVALEADGITVDRLALTYLVMYAELEALICSGPRRGKQQTYMSVDARVAPTATLDREEALVELLSRYLRSRGPATVKDFTAWSGLTVAGAKAGLALVCDELVCEVDGEGTAWWSAPDSAAAPASTGAHLIPMYDELTIAYRQARAVLAEQPPRSGLLERPILVDGMTHRRLRRYSGGEDKERGSLVRHLRVSTRTDGQGSRDGRSVRASRSRKGQWA